MREQLPRRALLRGLAASPVALAAAAFSPALAVALPPATFPEADRVRALAVLSQEACELECDAVSRFEAVEPDKPRNDPAEIRQAYDAIMDQCPNPVTLADNEVMQQFMKRAAAAGKVVRDRHEAATAH